MLSTISSNQKLFFSLGCFSAAIGVAAGAFGAHGLKSILSPDMLAVYETAVRYQMYHAFGLITAGWAASQSSNSKVRVAGWCFVVGTILFSGSLYALTLSGILWLGAITPLGGMAFIAGWLLLGFAILRR
jgi:uncharacterized membrane protein YgdD (TMEM256/DUF423 family)